MAEISHPGVPGLSQANNPQEETHVPTGRRVYEVAFHIIATLPEEGVAAVAQKVRAALGSAEIISEQSPQKMTLAYTVERSDAGKREKHNESYFGCIKFALERESIPALEASLRGMHEVLRYLLIETVREEIMHAPRRAVFTSDRLEGETIKKPESATPEKTGEVSEEDLDKSIEALVAE